MYDDVVVPYHREATLSFSDKTVVAIDTVSPERLNQW
jgi:hypothetical protein